MQRRSKIIATASIATLAVLTVTGLMAAGLHNAGPLSFLHTWDEDAAAIEKTYDPAERANEIVFYGASNFAYWETMEADLGGFRVQNHGLAGASDPDLIHYAERLLYPYDPSIVVFQTGSNDLVGLTGTDDEKAVQVFATKVQMFEEMHERLPDALFIVVSGLPLPGRAEMTPTIELVNDKLARLDADLDYLTYIDSESLTFDGSDYYDDKFIDDQIHLTPDARLQWANEFIEPALEDMVEMNGLDATRRP